MPEEQDRNSATEEPNSDAGIWRPGQPPADPSAPPQPSGENPNSNEGTTRKLEEDIKSGEKWLIGIGIASLLINSIIAWIYWGQLREMRKATEAATQASQTAKDTLNEMRYGSGSQDTHTLAQQAVTQATQTTNLAAASNTQADQLKLSVEQAARLAVAAGKQADASRIIAEDSSAQAKATNELATQAQRSADAASKQLAIMQAQFETSERPWISIISIEPVDVRYNADYVPFPSSQPIKNLGVQTIVTYKNIGNLPATDVKVDEKIYLANWKLAASMGESITAEAKRMQKQLCMSGRVNYPDSTQLRLNPGASEHADMGGGVLIDNPDYLVLNGAQSGGITPVVVGCIFYRYSSSPTIHHTGFIFYVAQMNTSGVIEYMRAGVAPALSNVRIQDVSNVAFSD